MDVYTKRNFKSSFTKMYLLQNYSEEDLTSLLVKIFEVNILSVNIFEDLGTIFTKEVPCNIDVSDDLTISRGKQILVNIARKISICSVQK